jgi:hypothetical protein
MLFRSTFEALFYSIFVKNDFFCNLNRSVKASPPSAARATQNPVGLRPCGFCSATFLLLRETASQFPLSQKQKRHLPPERYVQVLQFLFMGILTKIIINAINNLEEKWILLIKKIYL